MVCWLELIDMDKNIRNQTIALAGISQAVKLVQQIANTGSVDEQAMTVSVDSILKIETDSIEEIYGGETAYGAIEGLATGFDTLKTQLAQDGRTDVDQARYGTSLVLLERRLINDLTMRQAVTQGVAKAAAQAQHFSLVLHSSVIANLADLYQSTISTLVPRVMVKGEPLYLQNPDNANKIRVLLLAGIRSAVLWRQSGGGRLKFIMRRRMILDEVRRLKFACRG